MTETKWQTVNINEGYGLIRNVHLVMFLEYIENTVYGYFPVCVCVCFVEANGAGRGGWWDIKIW